MSTVVSKYIGETERSLSAIFREAELSHSLLFFDETHSLFGKRTEVKDAHDRYANIEVNYLLQPIEHYQGLVVLATNLQKNLDEAFLRRLHYADSYSFHLKTTGAFSLLEVGSGQTGLQFTIFPQRTPSDEISSAHRIK